MLYRSTEKANMFKAKRLIEKGGTRYLKQVLWSPQQTISDHRLYLSIQIWKFLSRIYSRFSKVAHHHKHTHSHKHTHTHTHSSAEHILALSTWLTIRNKLTHIDKHTHLHRQTHTHTHTHTHTQTHSLTYTNTHTRSDRQTHTLTHIDKHTH